MTRRGESDRPAAARSRVPPEVRRWALLVLALALAATVTTLRNGFTLDTQFDLTANAYVTKPGGLGALLTSDAWEGAGVRSGFWRPVVGLANWTLWRIGGGQSAVFFVANILLHAAISLLVLGLALRLGATTTVAGAAAALFAVHPVHADVLAGSVGLKDLLAAVFFLAALWLFLAARARPAEPVRPLAWGAACFAAGLLSKESVLALLPALTLLDLGRGTWRQARDPARRVAVFGPYLAMTAIAVARFVASRAALASARGVEGFDPAANPLVLLPPAARPLHALGLIPVNLGLLLWPARLAPDRSFNAIPVREGLDQPAILVGALLAAAFVALAYLAWSRGFGVPFAGLAIAAAAYLPVSNLAIAIPGQFVAERYLYLPSVGFCIAAAWMLAHPAAPRRLGIALLVLALAAGLARSNARNAEWRDKLTLWTAAHRVVPDSVATALAAAEQLRRAGDLERARAVIERGLAVHAPSPLTQSIEDRFRPSLLLLKGQILRDGGDLAGAEQAIRAAMAGRPDRNDWRSELANVLAMDGRLEDALHEIEAALDRASDDDERRVLERRREKLRQSLMAPRSDPRSSGSRP